MIAAWGGRDPAAFLAEVREKARARERKAARQVIGGLRWAAADLRATGDRPRRPGPGLGLVPAEAAGPIHEMRAQLLAEMGRPAEPGP